MKYLFLSCVLFLSGCAMFQKPVPVAPQWPDAPLELKKKCEELQKRINKLDSDNKELALCW